jgi:hypothetical protein
MKIITLMEKRQHRKRNNEQMYLGVYVCVCV